MHQYGVRDVEKLLHLPRSTIRALIAAGFVSPARGPRNAWLFSFQDLIVLRTAQALAAANVPPRRITRSVKDLRRHLPDAMPLSGLSICAVADRVVVKEGGSRWQVDSGQYLLGFEGDPADGSLLVTGGAGPSCEGTGGVGPSHKGHVGPSHAPRAPPSQATPAVEWLDRGIGLEGADAEAALQAYARAIAADPKLLDARINLGLLLHEHGRHSEAEQVYREALKACGADPVLLYNIGVLLEDMKRKSDAVEAYEAALHGNPDLADCHYNLALLYEGLKKPKEAIRHMARYRKLMKRRDE